MEKLFKLLFSLFLLVTTIQASESVPTQEEVAKLYVATFNRAPDAAGLNYWVNDSGLKLSGIAQSFFDAPETQALYPIGTTNKNFIESVYKNLFNREVDIAGLNYWENQLNIGSFTKNSFIQAVINGAQNTATSNDADILNNKTIVGLSFSVAGKTDVKEAKAIMANIGSDIASVDSAISAFGISKYTTNDNTSTTSRAEFAGKYSIILSAYGPDGGPLSHSFTNNIHPYEHISDGCMIGGGGSITVTHYTEVSTFGTYLKGTLDDDIVVKGNGNYSNYFFDGLLLSNGNYSIDLNTQFFIDELEFYKDEDGINNVKGSYSTVFNDCTGYFTGYSLDYLRGDFNDYLITPDKTVDDIPVEDDIKNYYSGSWTGTTHVYLKDNTNVYCKWNLNIKIASDNTTSATATLISHSNDEGECESFSSANGNIDNITDSGFLYTINNTSSEYIMGGNTFNFKGNTSQVTQSNTFTLFGYTAKRETSINKYM